LGLITHKPFKFSSKRMAFTNSAESTTEALAGIEEERTARGAKVNYLPLMAVFAFGAAEETRRATRLHFCPRCCSAASTQGSLLTRCGGEQG
jgi:hypothetical protein